MYAIPRRDLRGLLLARSIGLAPPPVARSWFVSDEAQQFYAEMAFRWHELIDWGVLDKLPEEQPAARAWANFAAAWEDGDEDPVGLNGLEPDLNRVVEKARALGFVARGDERIGGRDPDTLDDRAAAHTATQEVIQEARDAIEDVTDRAGAAVKPAIPYAVILAGLALVYFAAAGAAPLAVLWRGDRR